MSFILSKSRTSAFSICAATTTRLAIARPLTTTTVLRKEEWEGRKAKDHVVREQDNHNVQINAVKDGKKDRATSGDGTSSRGAGEESGGTNQKAKEDFPEAPDTIGMQDERGGKDTK